MKELFILFSLIALIPVIPGTLVGGWSTSEHPNSENMQKMSHFAALQISKSSNSLYMMKPINITEVKTQLVAGVKYNITMTVGSSECKKNQRNYEVEDLRQCKILDSEPVQICQVQIWDRSWIPNSTKLLFWECKRNPEVKEA